MQTTSRHQCLIYDGAPSRHLPALAATLGEKLRRNYRCLYLNSKPMVAGIRSYLAAAGVDVECELRRGSLVLSADQNHLVNERFDADRMLATLAETLRQSLEDGYAGLWATGDMTWELGPNPEYSKLLNYEQRLEDFFREHPEISGICQYHAGTLPREIMRQGLLVHPSIFVNETLSLLNAHYHAPARMKDGAPPNSDMDAALARHYQAHGSV